MEKVILDSSRELLSLCFPERTFYKKVEIWTHNLFVKLNLFVKVKQGGVIYLLS